MTKINTEFATEMQRFLILFVLTFLLCFGCASNSQDKEFVQEPVIQNPKWITDSGRLELFPDSLYISQLAYADSAENAKLNAASNISGYIKSSVKSSVVSSYFYKEDSTGFTENKGISENIQVATENDLFKIEYTNPYYYEDLGKYVCVAFINRNQAFDFVKPKLEVAKIEFAKAYSSALEKDSLLDKIIGIKNAQKILVEFYEVYDFARAINPAKAQVYEEVDFLANESFAKTRDLSNSILIKIESVGDVDLLETSGVIPELANQFSQLGFVVGNSLKYNCIALVEAKSSITESATTFETYPELYVKIIEKGREKISYSKKLGKVAGFDKDTVVRRTNLALVNEIKNSFVDECF